jgi:undecaprenyl-diphosphatase
MLDQIIELDKKILLFLNHLGAPTLDSFWLFVTKPLFWTPFFLLLLFLIYKKIGIKQALILLLFVSFLVLLTDQTSNFFKHTFQRLRPCNDPTINYLLHIIKPSKSFSFFSGHAATSMGVSVFLFLLMRKKYRFWSFTFIWPLFFGYSRMYLGLHFPTDILCGYLCGIMYGLVVFRLYELYLTKV